MSEIEKVSSFEYRVWRIKRWFFMNAVSVMVFAGLILSVWAVFDKDDFDDFNEAIERARVLGFKSAWSNEAFELWYYLHFEYLDTGIDRAAYIRKLEEAFRKKMNDNDFEYKKGNPEIYNLLQQYGREDLAKRYAKKLRGQYTGKDYASWKPCTMVDKLVEELEKPEKVLEELKKE